MHVALEMMMMMMTTHVVTNLNILFIFNFMKTVRTLHLIKIYNIVVY